MSYTNTTPNYGLPQYLSSDKPAWMADINVAFSDIDTQMKQNADDALAAQTTANNALLDIATGYSNLSTYSVGDLVIYQERLYICDVAVTVPEAFDNAKWSIYRVVDIADVADLAKAAADAVDAKVGSTDISGIGDGTCTGAIDELNTVISNKIKVTKKSFNGMGGGVVYDEDYELDDVFAFAILEDNSVDRGALYTWSNSTTRKLYFTSSIAQACVYNIVHIK